MADKDEIRESDNSRVPAQMVTLSINAERITVAKMCHQPVEIYKNTTLNEVLDIEVENSIGIKQGNDFVMHYFGVGIGGSSVKGMHRSLPIPELQVNQHQPTDQNLFVMIPVVARPLSNPLSPEERKDLRMREVFRKDGVAYELYYLRPIGFSKFNPKTKIAYREPTTGNEIPKDYVHRKEDLNPTPITLNEDGSVPLTDRMVTSTGLLDFTLTAKDMEEMRNACLIRYGDASLAAINEYAPFYGIESTTEGEFAGGARQRYPELISATISYMGTERHARDANANGSMELLFDIGTSSPLLRQ